MAQLQTKMFNIKQTGSLSTDNHIGSKNNFSHFEEELIRKSNKPKHEAKASFTNFTWFLYFVGRVEIYKSRQSLLISLPLLFFFPFRKS